MSFYARVSRPRRATWPAIIFVALTVLLVSDLVSAERPALEGDPFRGREVFADKGCLRCHSIWRHGGIEGPDITQVVAGKTWHELVGDFWNHTPQMIDAVVAGGFEWPTLTRREMADLLSYLYYLRLFDDPGDARRGASTYGGMECATCHTLAGRGGSGGGPLDEFSVYATSLPLAQAMWNAGPAMQEEQRRRGIHVPQFRQTEMADLQAFLRAEGLRSGRQIVLQPLPDPSHGAEVFANKRCGSCHDDDGGAPDLTFAATAERASEIAGLLWNHSSTMSEEMSSQSVPFPRFEGRELSDLIAYLYFLGYLGDEGDVARGVSIFEKKGCAGCHDEADDAPNLASDSLGDKVGIAVSMWNHAPPMHELMADRSVSWPKFEPGEMGDLAAYLTSLASAADDGDDDRGAKR